MVTGLSRINIIGKQSMGPETFKMNKPEKNPGFEIPESELEFSFSRSGGKGGQNVNKLETKATVRWNFKQSAVLNDAQKHLIAEKLKNRINEKGELIVSAQEERSQLQNKERAIEILNQLAQSALTVAPERIPTKIPRSAQEKRLKEKARQAQKKEMRQGVDY